MDIEMSEQVVMKIIKAIDSVAVFSEVSRFTPMFRHISNNSAFTPSLSLFPPPIILSVLLTSFVLFGQIQCCPIDSNNV